MIIEFKINSVLNKDLELIKIKKYVEQSKKTKKTFKVLDVGGGVRNKAGIPIDTLFDLSDESAKKNTNKIEIIKKDFCTKDGWDTIEDDHFDYCICTHTLEDVRDPYFVIQQIIRTSKEGYIAVPHKYRELNFSTSKSVLGYAHHRWIFGMENGVLNIISKSNILDYLIKTKKISAPHNSKKYFFRNVIRYLLFLIKNKKNAFLYSERKDSISHYEIAFRFQDKFDFKLVDDDCFLPPHDNYIAAIQKILSYEDSL